MGTFEKQTGAASLKHEPFTKKSSLKITLIAVQALAL